MIIYSIMDSTQACSAMYQKFSKVDDWEVLTYRSVNGGGTGQEFSVNLKYDIDAPGNKWYDCWSGETWIKGNFYEKSYSKNYFTIC